MKRAVAVTMALLLVTATALPAAAASTNAAASTQSAEAYTGAHVSFQTNGSAITDYAVDGELFAENVSVESQSAYESRLGVDADVRLSAVTSLQGTSTSLGAQSSATVTVETSGSSTVRAHDNEHGHLVVDAGDGSQYVQIDVPDGATVEQQSDSQLVIETENGSTGSVIVAGDGEVTTNDAGNVAASLSGDAKLVLRTHSDSQSDADQQIEEYVANGTMAAEAYVTERGGEITSSAVAYQAATVEASQSASNEVTMTVDRAQSQGKIVAMTVSKEAIGSVDDLDVAVDGNAAVKAESYSELEGAIGNEPRYMVVSETSASATVLVGIDHFSEREVTMSGGDGSDSSDGLPGFGVLPALVALLGAVGLARRT
ncbi:PGF-CTERM protein [Natronoarchaeum philippinense]|uniref:PGF-CTERM protein n=1 Tax=Natronoarchaeum philippinense TaxID=558529 RepID=A0A285NSK0_NATPI|nr:PGF-CTERM sorting domain-containing protein [Natronoarchaeum philippinense]SNZ12472.1 PGF-CTERM protein [Natronoarchaeum philippinense]